MLGSPAPPRGLTNLPTNGKFALAMVLKIAVALLAFAWLLPPLGGTSGKSSSYATLTVMTSGHTNSVIDFPSYYKGGAG